MEVEAIRSIRYKFKDDPIFKQREIEKMLFTFDGDEPALPSTGWYAPSLSEEQQRDKQERLTPMSRAQERLMFLRMNFCKRKLTMLDRHYHSRELTREGALQFREWHRRYVHYREYIVRMNLGLFYVITKRLPLRELDWADVVSDANTCLLRSVEGFNVGRGFKFSTYACRAIARELGRMAEKAAKRRSRSPVSLDTAFERSDWTQRMHTSVEDECVSAVKEIVDRNLADLSNVEQTVVRRRFNWEGADEESLTLEKLGQIIGVTKERVRQIQNKALKKIRKVMEEGVLRTRYSKPKPPQAE